MHKKTRSLPSWSSHSGAAVKPTNTQRKLVRKVTLEGANQLVETNKGWPTLLGKGDTICLHEKLKGVQCCCSIAYQSDNEDGAGDVGQTFVTANNRRTGIKDFGKQIKRVKLQSHMN